MTPVAEKPTLVERVTVSEPHGGGIRSGAPARRRSKPRERVLELVA
jgi:hypothetical protein